MGDQPALAPLDLISAKLHRDERPLDFTAILEIDADASLIAGLPTGAASACRLFPSSASRVDGRRWVWSDDVPFEALPLASSEAVQASIDAFVNQGKNPHDDMQVRQRLIHRSGGKPPVLLTRFHHCAFDGVSASMWLFHQLMVASGQLEPEHERGEWTPPELSSHDTPHRKSKYSHVGGARRLWTASPTPSRTRRWLSMQLECAAYRKAVSSVDGITYNDFLAAHFTQALVQWNAQHAAPTSRMGLWLPTNIRPQAFVGFGNGSSRMRVYADAMKGPSAAQRCQQFREQVDWSRDNGEWYVPPIDGLLKLPDSWLTPILRGFLGRPGVDMGTAPFTHLERIGSMERFVSMIHSARWVMMLHKWHPLGMAAATLGKHTDMTLTYDPSMVSEEDATAFLALYQTLLDTGLAELNAGSEE